ncbi:MAG: hypothetical protein IKG21_08845 [Atopobiaceae bacterium]|nr:hypothetical protein [Atopobiaceae bacterium]
MSVVLAPIFTSGMILQRELPVRVWGTANPGARVEVCVQGQSASCVANKNGAWSCTLAPLHASDAETLEVRTGDDRVALSDVAVGEVFVAAGQSNMEFWMRYDQDMEEFRPTCNNARIRFYDQPKCSYPHQTDDFDYSKVGVWRKATSEDLEYFSAVGYYFARGLEMVLDVPVGIVGCNYGGTKSSAWMKPEHARAVQPEQVAAFEAQLQGLPYEELLANGRLNVMANNKGLAEWSAWNEFFLPQVRTEEEGQVFMAAATGDAAAVIDAQIKPGMLTPTKHAPGALFTYMVLPIAGFSTRGVLWYQGESDDEDDGAQARYAEALRTIIADWREAWQCDDLPFLVVQLPGLGRWEGMSMDARDWPTIRAGQQKVADEDERVWLCSIGDMGNKRDIHPKEKKPVGERLSLLAMRHLLGMPVPADAPRCVGVERKGPWIILQFDHAEGGLVLAGAEVNALEVLRDGVSVPFHAGIRGDRLVLAPEEATAEPLEVRFAQNNWYRINLYNGVEIPVLPFSVSC